MQTINAPGRPIKVAAHTLGCKVNKWDTHHVLEKLTALGCQIVPFAMDPGADAPAHIYIVNTCTVTHVSDKKSRQIIRRVKGKNPHALVAVCGCMTNKDKAREDIKALNIDYVFDARQPQDFIDFVKKMAGDLNALAQPNPSLGTPRQTRAFVKIQDGCNRFCSYCIVPYVRGDIKSRPAADILSEIENYTQQGVLEIVLTGIQVAAYGEDRGNTLSLNLTGLMEKILQQMPGHVRLRLSSIEPHGITPGFIGLVKKHKNLCPHLHISLQSGSQNTLQAMARPYTPAAYAHMLQELKQAQPHMAVTTDIIVGFPGESDQDFADSLAFVKSVSLAGIHVFEYSKREGTPAATFENQVPDHVKTSRSKAFRQLGQQLKDGFYASLVGQTWPVLFEKSKNKNTAKGYTPHYAQVQVAHLPDFLGLPNLSSLPGTIQNVKITSYTQGVLWGHIQPLV